MFSKSLEHLIGSCYKTARTERLEYMGVEQLLLALLNDDEVEKCIEACNGDIQLLRSNLQETVDNTIEKWPVGESRDTQPTLGFQRVLQRAVYHVQSAGDETVEPINCLIALYGENDSHAVYFLQSQDIHRLDVVNFQAHGISKTPPPTTVEKIERIAEGVFASSSSGRLAAPERLRIFISYSHRDSACLERLLVHLKPLVRDKKIDCWSDTTLRAGDKWKEQIANQIDCAAVAILILSADFLASDFIVNHELPPLLMKAEAKGTRIIPVIAKPCGFHRNEVLKNFQSINDPKKPLLGLSEIDQEHLYDLIADDIHNELQTREKQQEAVSS